MAGLYMTDDPSGLESMGILSDLSPELAMQVVSDQIPTIITDPQDYSEGMDYLRSQVPIYGGALPIALPAAAVPAIIPKAVQVAKNVGPAVGLTAAALATLHATFQGLGLGEGGGLGDINLLGGDDSSMGGVEFGGPGLPEPAAKQVLKEWHVNYTGGLTLQYYLVQTGVRSRKIFMYNTKTKVWKYWAWRSPHLAVIGKNMPSHKQITRLRRNLSRHAADAQTILKLTRPHALRTPRRRR